MVWILVSETANQLTCNICPYMYYDERTEWYTCKRIKRSVNACVWDEKRHDKCPIQATDTPPIPAADVVEVKHGQWIDKAWTTEDDWGCYNHRVVICSVCNKQFDYIIKEHSNYCPNCGAKMEGGKNE